MTEEQPKQEWWDGLSDLRVQREKDYRALSEEIGGVKQDMGGIKTAIGGIQASLDRMSQKDSKGFNWAPVTMFLVLGLAVIGGFSSGYIRDQDRMQEQQKESISREIEQAYHTGQQDAKLEDAQKVTKELDITLQREMRLLDERADEKVRGMDERLQMEMRLLGEADKVRLDQMVATIVRILTWQDQHDKRVVGLNAAQWESIRSLERQVFGKRGSHKTEPLPRSD